MTTPDSTARSDSALGGRTGKNPDIVDRLRARARTTNLGLSDGDLHREAADEIDGLRRLLVDIRSHYGDCFQGPGHSHQEPGIWDADNHPFLAGTQCEWCALWDNVRVAVRAAHPTEPSPT